MFDYTQPTGTQLQNGFHQLATFTEGQSGEIAVVANQEVENKIVNTGCFTAEILKQIEVWSARFIESDDLTINDCTTTNSCRFF